MADFSEDVSRWVDGRRAKAREVFVAIATDAVNRVKELTPVDTGFLRSNWTAMKPGDTEPVAGRVQDPMAVITTARIGDTIVIVNPTEYARRIEYGFVGEDSLGRHYSQQGAHMVAQTMAELPRIAQEARDRIEGR